MKKLIQSVPEVIAVIVTSGLLATGVTNGQDTYPPTSPPLVPVAEYPNSSSVSLPDSDASPMSRPKRKPDGRITLELNDGSRLLGKPSGLRQVKLRTQFGEIEIPFRAIAGIRMPNPEESSPQGSKLTTLVFKNGDVLSGELDLESIELSAAWGKATVAIQQTKSIINSTGPHAWTWHSHWHLIPGAVYPTTPTPIAPGAVYGPTTTPAPTYQVPVPGSVLPPARSSERSDPREFGPF